MPSLYSRNTDAYVPGAVEKSEHNETTANLLRMGASFVSSLAEAWPNTFGVPPTDVQQNSGIGAQATPSRADHISRLHHECEKALGCKTDTLTYDYVPRYGGGVKYWGCSLIAKSISGFTRTYTVESNYSTKKNAQQAVAMKALENDITSFLVGSSAHAAHSSASTELLRPAGPSNHRQVTQIEHLWSLYFEPHAKPFWLFSSSKIGDLQTYGCLLEIRVSTRNARVWSVGHEYNSPEEAQRAVVEIAVQDGVEGFMRQFQSSFQSFPQNIAVSHGLQSSKRRQLREPRAQVSLHSFLRESCDPLPSDIGFESSQVNPIAWMNIKPQQSKGKLDVKYEFFTDSTPKNFGCLLRLEAVGTSKSKSYFVDALFVKKQDAKTAVCARAISDGCVNFINELVSVHATTSTAEKCQDANALASDAPEVIQTRKRSHSAIQAAQERVGGSRRLRKQEDRPSQTTAFPYILCGGTTSTISVLSEKKKKRTAEEREWTFRSDTREDRSVIAVGGSLPPGTKRKPSDVDFLRPISGGRSPDKQYHQERGLKDCEMSSEDPFA